MHNMHFEGGLEVCVCVCVCAFNSTRFKEKYFYTKIIFIVCQVWSDDV